MAQTDDGEKIHAMSMNRPPTIHAARLERVRDLRTRRSPDLSLGFLAAQFKRTVARPYRQFRDACRAWEKEVPAALAERTRLEGLSRGVLRVGVNSSAHLYELDRLLRGGMEERILSACRGATPPRRIRLHLAKF